MRDSIVECMTKLKNERKVRRISQEGMAKIMNIERRTYIRMEKGNISLEAFLSMCEFFGYDISMVKQGAISKL